MTSSCMSSTPLPITGSSRSSVPALASSDFGSVVHPITHDSSGFNNAVSGVVHPVIVAGGSNGAIIAKASIILDSVGGGSGGTAADCVTLCRVLVHMPMLAYIWLHLLRPHWLQVTLVQSLGLGQSREK